jgi:hypothetical protein
MWPTNLESMLSSSGVQCILLLWFKQLCVSSHTDLHAAFDRLGNNVAICFQSSPVCVNSTTKNYQFRGQLGVLVDIAEDDPLKQPDFISTPLLRSSLRGAMEEQGWTVRCGGGHFG